MEWNGDIKARFFAGGANGLPVVDYAPVKTKLARKKIAKAANMLTGDHPVLQWLTRTAVTLETTASLLETRGAAAFYDHSKALYGTPTRLLLDGKTQVLELARHMDSTLTGLTDPHLVLEGADEALSDDQFVEALRPLLGKHFGESAPRVELTPNLSAKASAGSKRIRVRAGAKFTQMDVAQLLQHEALVHTATALNGRSHGGFPILGTAHAGTTQIQEGLAVFAEMISGTMDPTRFRRLSDRVIAIQMSVEGADFIQVYQYYLERSDDPDQSFENTRRIFRGGVLTGGAPFTKDMVYLNGLLRVHNFLRMAVKLGRADLIRLLFVGKLDLEDIPALAILADMGELTPPEFLPDWAKDLRFVVSYLAYSSFLNRVKMPGFRDYYEDMLAKTPGVWSFTS
jgi:uncharacterized protein (TIGR02421 family)